MVPVVFTFLYFWFPFDLELDEPVTLELDDLAVTFRGGAGAKAPSPSKKISPLINRTSPKTASAIHIVDMGKLAKSFNIGINLFLSNLVYGTIVIFY